MPIKLYSTFGPDYVPTKGTEQSAGFDIRTPEDIIMPPDSTMIVDTGLILDATHLPRPLMYMLVPRSSAGIKHGLMLQNTVGIVDQDYAGPTDTIKVALRRLPKAHWVCEGPVGKDYRPKPLEEVWKGQLYRRHPQYAGLGGPQVLYEKGDRFVQLLIMEHVNEVFKMVDSVEVLSDDRGMNSTGDK